MEVECVTCGEVAKITFQVQWIDWEEKMSYWTVYEKPAPSKK